MRILICSNAYPPQFMGGAELMAHEQALMLAKFGHEVCIFSGNIDLSRDRYSRIDTFFDKIPVRQITLYPEDYSPEYINFIHEEVENHFLNVLNEFNPDIVHCHNLMGLSVKIPLLSRQHGSKTLCTLHDFWGFCLRNTAIRPSGVECGDITECQMCLPRIHNGQKQHVPMRFRKDFIKLACESIDHFIAPSRYIKERYVDSGWLKEDISVIQNGVSIDKFYNEIIVDENYNNEIKIIFVGYIGEHKGVSTLIDGFSILLDRVKKDLEYNVLSMTIVGDGPDKEKYNDKIISLGLKDKISFSGKVSPSDMPDMYAGSDIVVLPSIWSENQPVCLMEGMAAGRPVIASRKGGIPEIVDHGVNGLMFSAGNATDLADQLFKLVKNRELRKIMGRNGYDYVKKIDHENQTNIVVDLYKSTIKTNDSKKYNEFLFFSFGVTKKQMISFNDILNDNPYIDYKFMPYAWLKNLNISKFDGILLTGVAWNTLARIKIFPLFFINNYICSIIIGIYNIFKIFMR